MPKCFGYVRVSKLDQALGYSLENQIQQCRQLYERDIRRFTQPKTGETIAVDWADIINDAANSASKKNFSDRPGGRKLLAEVRREDHVIFWKVDRVFRNLRDFAVTWEVLEQMGVRVHPIDAPMDPNTASGRLLLNQLAVYADYESRVLSERIKAGLSVAKANGKSVGRQTPLGYMKVPDGTLTRNGIPRNDLVPDWVERECLVALIRVVEIECCLCWTTVSRKMHKIVPAIYAAHGITAYKQVFKRSWKQDCCWWAHKKFWEVLCVKDGIDWIADDEVKGIVRLKQAGVPTPRERKRDAWKQGPGYIPGA